MAGKWRTLNLLNLAFVSDIDPASQVLNSENIQARLGFISLVPQRTQDAAPVLAQCWTNLCDVGAI